jgi:hypothetical protein
MQNLINQQPLKKNYDFIDAIRGIAMMSIVAEHCVTTIGMESVYPYGSVKYWTNLALIQFTKFGTITFFLLAGFLLGDKFTDYTPGQYLKRRISSTFGPWVLWSLIFALMVIARWYVKIHNAHPELLTLNNILNLIEEVYMYSSYWFIINFLISISVLLIFRRYLYSLYLGLILGLFTSFYAVNIHYEWVSPRHTTAILGFVFFLWLGAQLRKHLDKIEVWLKNTPYLFIVIVLLFTYGLSFYECSALNGKSVDPFNSLRISNILYSFACFALLLKIKTFGFIKYIKPRQTTYGIYLIHLILIVFLMPKLFVHFNIVVVQLHAIPFLLYNLLNFLLAYLVTWCVVLLISNSGAKKLIGA